MRLFNPEKGTSGKRAKNGDGNSEPFIAGTATSPHACPAAPHCRVRATACGSSGGMPGFCGGILRPVNGNVTGPSQSNDGPYICRCENRTRFSKLVFRLQSKVSGRCGDARSRHLRYYGYFSMSCRWISRARTEIWISRSTRPANRSAAATPRRRHRPKGPKNPTIQQEHRHRTQRKGSKRPESASCAWRCRRRRRLSICARVTFEGCWRCSLSVRTSWALRQKTVGVGQQNQARRPKEQCGGRKSSSSMTNRFCGITVAVSCRFGSAAAGRSGRAEAASCRAHISAGTQRVHLSGCILAGCILAGAAPETRDGFRDKGTKYSECARSDKTVSVRPAKRGVHPPGNSEGPVGQNSVHPSRQTSKGPQHTPALVKQPTPVRQNCGGTRRQDARSRTSGAVFRRIGRHIGPPGICGGTGPPGRRCRCPISVSIRRFSKAGAQTVGRRTPSRRKTLRGRYGPTNRRYFLRFLRKCVAAFGIVKNNIPFAHPKGNNFNLILTE